MKVVSYSFKEEGFALLDPPSTEEMSSSTTAAQAEKDDYNVRHYAFHLYYAYCLALYTVVGVMMIYSPQLVLSTYYGYGGELDLGGLYEGRHSGAMMLTMALLTYWAWRSKSGPVRDLIIKCHFAHHGLSLLVDWIMEAEGFVSKSWQFALFSPHPFFTVLILFLWSTDKRRDLPAEEREANGGRNPTTSVASSSSSKKK